MKRTSTVFHSLMLATSLAAACKPVMRMNGNGKPSLKDAYKTDFLVGTAINAIQIEERDPAADSLIKQQFNAATPENVMKAAIIHPAWNRFDFALADKLVVYGNRHNIKINGHTLIWHSQLPAYIRQVQDADSVRQFFEEHIRTIAARYDGKILSWDVVNEALNEDGSMRNSIFLQKLGAGYVVEAFRLAQKAAPHTELYYNDYNIEEPKKRAGAIELIKKIQAAGVRIDGVGIQAHWQLHNIPLKQIEESIEEFGALGIKVMFTELDISVLPNPWRANTANVEQRAENSAQMNPYPGGLPDSIGEGLARDYQDLFKLFLKYRNKIGRITFWGVHDGQSWLNDWPIKGRTNYPLLFDRLYHPKPAYYSVLNAKE